MSPATEMLKSWTQFSALSCHTLFKGEEILRPTDGRNGDLCDTFFCVKCPRSGRNIAHGRSHKCEGKKFMSKQKTAQRGLLIQNTFYESKGSLNKQGLPDNLTFYSGFISHLSTCEQTLLPQENKKQSPEQTGLSPTSLMDQRCDPGNLTFHKHKFPHL